MAQQVIVKSACRQCGGTGTFQYPGKGGGSEQCPWPGCNGTGSWIIGHVVLDPGLDDVMDRIQDLADTQAALMNKLNDILEAIQNP